MADPVPEWTAVLGRVPSGLFILTAMDDSAETAMLASWVMQCSFAPPRVSVAVKPDRHVYGWLRDGAAFTLNLIPEGDKRLLSHFGKGFGPGEEAFTGVNVERTPGEAPILGDALGHLFCRVVTRVSAGDHDLIVGTVVGGRMQQTDGKPYIHVRKNGLRY